MKEEFPKVIKDKRWIQISDESVSSSQSVEIQIKFGSSMYVDLRNGNYNYLLLY